MSSRGSAATRAAILDAAKGLFEVEGYHDVGLEAVAKKASVSRQAIYLHFSSKAELLSALHVRINEQHVAPAMAKVWASPDAVAAVDAFVAATATAVPNFLGIFNVLESAIQEPVVEATWRRPLEGRRADCMRLAKWLADEGCLARGIDSRRAADVLFAVASVRMYEALVVTCGWSVRQWKDWTRQALRDALL